MLLSRASAKLAILGLVLALALPLAGCPIVRGSGNIITESRGVTDFNKVVAGFPGNVEIEQAGLFEGVSVEVTGDDNIVPLVKTQVANNTLTIEYDAGAAAAPTQDTLVRITMGDIEQVTLSGAGEVDITDISGDAITLEVTGSGSLSTGTVRADEVMLTNTASGSLTTSVQTNEVRASLQGTGAISVSGSTNTQNVSNSGSGNYNGSGLTCDDTTVTVSGSGDARVVADDTLNATVSGSGDIIYSGSPESVTTDTPGSGSITQDS